MTKSKINKMPDEAWLDEALEVLDLCDRWVCDPFGEKQCYILNIGDVETIRQTLELARNITKERENDKS